MATTDPGFLGIGWSFPPRFVHARGEVEMVQGEDDIAEALRILFGTVAGERLLQPDWGVSPRELLFEPVGTTLRTLLLDQVRTALLVHESRIKVLDLRVAMGDEPGSGTLAIELDYEVRSTNARFNLVFPSYRNDANELRARLAPALPPALR
jgi:phage baseplate assembly protein W